jgi:outer membrane protein assembly factor BamD
MKRQVLLWLAITFCVLALPYRAPAPLVYRPGEGWTYEPVGGGGTQWQRTRAKDQLDVAQKAFDTKDYNLALRAARRVISVWPVSDYAPPAQYLMGRCYEAKDRDDKAFAQYDKILDKYPKFPNYDDVLHRQFEIANEHLNGKWFKLWGVIPYPSLDKTADMYAKIVKSGPFSDVGPQAQLKLAATREKQKNYPLAVKAYETAADRYHDRPPIASEALFREGLAYNKQANKAEYDQSSAGSAISTFEDFMSIYPNDPRVPDALKDISTLKSEQARGSFQTARFYERYKKPRGALVYYNEVVQKDPNSSYAAAARQRIDVLTKWLQAHPK